MKKTFIWILAVVITLTAAIYQRKTGPTYPKDVEIEISGKQLEFELPRSHGGNEDAIIILPIEDEKISGQIHYRRFPTGDFWKTKKLIRQGDSLLASLPHQPPAGKIEYYITIFNNRNSYQISKHYPIRIRFKGAVPNWVLIPHVLIMFLAMLFSNVSGLFAAWNFPKQRLYGIITLILLAVGGMTLGPIMQHYAFGEAWTGIPVGWDLTDNKTLIAFIAWIIAVIANYKKQRPYFTVAAAIILLIIYSIPHSLMGSEFNYETGEVITGSILIFT